MSGEEINLHDVELGRITGEGLVKVNLRLEWKTRPYQTIHHDHRDSGYWAFGVSGSLWARRNSPDCYAAGQIIRAVKRLRTPTARELCRLWDRWHLNDMKGACAHMTTPKVYDRDTAPVCPESGYRYGSAWLVEEIPDEEIEAIRRVATWIRED